ncbi:MAG: serine/threonine-protein kinase [Rubripirellula sp.]
MQSEQDPDEKVTQHADDHTNDAMQDIAPTWKGLQDTFENETVHVSREHKEQSSTNTQPLTTEESRKSTDLPSKIGSYEIVAELGRGGMGVVYKARDLRLKRTVALKVILAGTHAADSERKRFQTEAESVARLKHQNIVQVYEVGESEGHPFLALEYCSGGSLADRLKGTRPSPREAAALVASLSDAMEHSHLAGVVHRDLKPANVLFDADGTPKIADFGLAKKLDEDEGHTRTGAIMGSLGYMSPEQASGQNANTNSQTDVYAMGAILYSLLAGHPPFQGSNAIETLNLVMIGEPIPIRRTNPTCPRDLETISLKCLNKLPSDRYPTSRDFHHDLTRYIKGEPIHARPSTTYEQLFSWCRRNPLPTTVAIASLLMLALLSASFAWIAHRNQSVIQTIETRDMRVEELRGKILYLDEVLTNSCALATLTDDSKWAERYQQYEPELIASIDEAVALVPDAKSELDKVNDANGQLIELEANAFALVKEGRSTEAWSLISSDTYQLKKRDYEHGLQVFSRKLRDHSEETVRAARSEAFAFLITAIVFAVLVLIFFAIGLYSFFRMIRKSDPSFS